MKNIKSIIFRIVAAFNVVTVLFMLAIGYSDRVNPTAYPLIANIGLVFPLFLLLNIAFLVFWLLFCKRGALISLVGMIVCFGPVRTYVPLNVPSSAPEDALKIMSYNVFCFSTWTDLSQPCAIADYMLEQDADIVCLQEADVQWAKRVKIDSLMDVKYPYRKYSGSKNPKGGDAVGIYSKLPIVGEEYISTEEDTYNAVSYALKTGEKDTTLVIVAHFQVTGLSPEDRTRFKSMLKGDMESDETKQETHRLWNLLGESSAKRGPQADAVAEYIEHHKHQSIILAGDFNDSPISYTHQRLAKELTDCYVATANGPGISYHYNAFYVRIDNIMCSDHWKPYECKVDNSISASDHYPIVCKLQRVK